MRGVLSLVIVMTVILFGGMGLLGYSLATQKHRQDDIALKELDLPSISTVQTISAWRDGIALYVVTPAGEYIYFIDPQREKPMRLPIVRKQEPQPSPENAVQNP